MPVDNPTEDAAAVNGGMRPLQRNAAPSPASRRPAGHNSDRVVEVDPFRCRIWELHDRLSDYVTDESCKAEIESVARHGQLVPALGRPLHGNHDFDVEIIYGGRRLYVARHLNVSLKVELRELSDQEALIAMDVENRHRTDLSPYERGLSYARWLRTPYFKSQDDIVRALGVSASHVSRVLKLAQLPTVLIGAFATPLELRESWGLELLEHWQDPARRPLLSQRARSIAAHQPRAGAEQVFRYLIDSAGKARRASPDSRDSVVKADNGSPLFRVRHQRNAIAIVLPSSALSESRFERIRRAVSEILQAP
jgi:ParB family chromosome partitioning protein